MRIGTVVVLAVWAVLLGDSLRREAEAADFFTGRTLQPGADAGTLAHRSLLDAGVGNGSHFMMRCQSYDVFYKVCSGGTATTLVSGCSANANDKYVGANRDYDICGVNGFDTLSVFRPYDAGVPNCRLYRVVPQSRDCQP